MLQAFIIDDNANNLEILQMLLMQENVESTTVQMPRQVRHAVSGLHEVDVIFVDLEYPQGDGYQVLEILRGYPHLQDVPIIAYSVHTSEIDKARQAGFNGFLGKPLRVQQFPEQLRRILRREGVWEG